MNKRRLKKAFKKLEEEREPTAREMSAILAAVPLWLRRMMVAARLVVDSMKEMATAIGGLSRLKLFNRGGMDN